MSCTACGNSFGFLRKEVTCEGCGFVFCSKCCCKRSYTKDEEDVKGVICSKCLKESGSDSKPETYSPPLAHKKRMAALGSRSQSLSADAYSSREQEKDKEIAERLQKLKKEIMKGPPSSQDDLEQRLAKLKGMDPGKYTAPPITVYRPPTDKRTAVEQAVDLFKQVQEEVEIDAKAQKPFQEMASRLRKLKGEPPSTEKPGTHTAFHELETPEEQMDIDSESKTMGEESDYLLRQASREVKDLQEDEEFRSAMQRIKSKQKEDESEELSEEEETDKVLKQLLTVSLEDPDSLNGQLVSPDSESEKPGISDSNEEFPWCTICTEDAKIRCFGCDGDLYCMRCFKECHDSLDIKDHKTCPYLQPKM